MCQLTWTDPLPASPKCLLSGKLNRRIMPMEQSIHSNRVQVSVLFPFSLVQFPGTLYLQLG